jgi:hypothetical protein
MTFKSFQGQVRPLVEAAWRNHAGLYGCLTSDRVERDEWYRANLWAACHIRSSKEATERQRVALIGYFEHLSPAPVPAAPVGNVAAVDGILIDHWTDAQLNAFFKLARSAHAKDERGSEMAFETWLEGVMQEAFRPDSIHGPDAYWQLGDRKRGFDRAMGALAVIASDRYWMDRTADGTERRLRWQLERFLADLSWLEGKTADWSYVLGIHKQAHANLPPVLEDVTTPQLVDVLQMLDTQIRRLCSKFDLRPCLCPTRQPTGITVESDELLKEWNYYHHPTPGHTRGPDGILLQQKGAA